MNSGYKMVPLILMLQSLGCQPNVQTSGTNNTGQGLAGKNTGIVGQLAASVAGGKFIANEVEANAKYVGQNWYYVGQVDAIKDSVNGPILYLGDFENNIASSTIVASFPVSERAAVAKLKPGQSILIAATVVSFSSHRPNRMSPIVATIKCDRCKLLEPNPSPKSLKAREIVPSITVWHESALGKSMQEVESLLGKPFRAENVGVSVYNIYKVRGAHNPQAMTELYLRFKSGICVPQSNDLAGAAFDMLDDHPPKR
jgi:hypothetical protein